MNSFFFNALLVLVFVLNGCADSSVAIIANDQEVREGNTELLVTLRLTQAVGRPVSVSFQTIGLSAAEMDDFIPTSGILTLSPGEVEKSLTIPVRDDQVFEDNEEFAIKLNLESGSGSEIKLAQDLIVVTLVDNDELPVFNFVQKEIIVNERDGRVSIPYVLDKAYSKPVFLPVDFTGSLSLVDDFEGINKNLFSIPPGVLEGSLDIWLRDDDAVECDERMQISLSDSSVIRAGKDSSINLLVKDDDARSPPLFVGKNRIVKTPSEASKNAGSYTQIMIDQGEYIGDVAVWRQNDVAICGLGDGVKLIASGQSAQGKGIWVINGNNVVVDNFSFYDAKVKHKNGAGIRAQGKHLTVQNSRFVNNENGILVANIKGGKILVENSVFTSNGSGDGKSHGVYVGKVDELKIRFSVLQGTRAGHNLKSRARTSFVEYNHIYDGKGGRASYQLDFSDGGHVFVVGNVIQQGEMAENWTMIAYGLEGSLGKDKALYLVNNTIVNDRKSGAFYRLAKGSRIESINNFLVGNSEHDDSEIDAHHISNVSVVHAEFRNAAEVDYRLTSTSPAIDVASDDFIIDGESASPVYEFIKSGHIRIRPQNGKLDVGAYEYY